jgi:hypothetical protein
VGWAGQIAEAERSAAAEGSVSVVGCAHDDDPSRVVAVARTDRGRPRMSLDVDVVIVAIVALTVLLLVAGAEAMWRRRGRRATAYAPRPTSGPDRVTAVVHTLDAVPSGVSSPGLKVWHTYGVCLAALKPEWRGASSRSSPSIAPIR